MNSNAWTRSSRTMRHGWMTAVAVAFLWPAGAGLMAQEQGVTGSTVSLAAGAASLELALADGEARVISLREGEVLIDGEVQGTYEPGGTLDNSWRSLLTSPALFEGSGLADRLAEWVPDASGDAEAASGNALESLFDRLAEDSNRTAAEAVLPETATLDIAGGDVAIAPGRITSLGELSRGVELLDRQLEVLRGQVAGLDENLALVVHDDYSVGANQLVEGNLALLSGDLDLGGTVDGDVLVLDGTLTLSSSANVRGDILQVGGEVIDAGGRVSGEMVSLLAGDAGSLVSGDFEVDLADEDLPVRVNVRSGERGFFGSIGHNIGHAVSGIMASIVWLLALAVLGFVVVYFFRSRLEVVAQVVRMDTVRAFGVGLAGQLLVLPVLLLLVVGIVTWLVIPVYALAVALAIPAGYLAVAHAVGERVEEQRFSWMERFDHLKGSSSYHHVFKGLVFLLAPFAIASALYLLGGMLGFVRGLMFFAATVMTWAAVTTGFGAIIITRAGGRRGRASQADFDDLFSAPESFDDEPEGEASA
ncbi:MAG: polymer-forming cytoskeletal protein [Gemmatimonadetes bacterium]|nr:polymer-forming cytoskeletal protein [Gemmatimonadota bacterium]